MTFGKPRFSKKYEYELIRYCSVGSVIGGASRLLTAFERDHNQKSIISYCDLRWGTGNLYDKLGFTKLEDTAPGYFYVKDGSRYNRMLFMKKTLVKKGHDPELSECQIMKNEGYRRIWDCGNGVYEKIY
jgi:hypothetical protein